MAIESRLGLLRLLIISYGTVTVTVYGYRSDTAVYGYFLTLVNTVNTVHFVKLRYFTVFYGYFGIFLPTVMYGYVRLCTVTAVIAVITVNNRTISLRLCTVMYDYVRLPRLSRL